MIQAKTLWTILVAGVVAGCGNIDAAHLVFGQQQNVGLDISASAPDQGAHLTLGYKDKNIAVIPVAVKEGAAYKLLGATNNESADSDRNDAYSTLGQFELKAGEQGATSVGLGKFFATGLAAQKLAEGFKEALTNKN